jgi:hypothetical protein
MSAEIRQGSSGATWPHGSCRTISRTHQQFTRLKQIVNVSRSGGVRNVVEEEQGSPPTATATAAEVAIGVPQAIRFEPPRGRACRGGDYDRLLLLEGMWEVEGMWQIEL